MQIGKAAKKAIGGLKNTFNTIVGNNGDLACATAFGAVASEILAVGTTCISAEIGGFNSPLSAIFLGACSAGMAGIGAFCAYASHVEAKAERAAQAPKL